MSDMHGVEIFWMGCQHESLRSLVWSEQNIYQAFRPGLELLNQLGAIFLKNAHPTTVPFASYSELLASLGLHDFTQHFDHPLFYPKTPLPENESTLRKSFRGKFVGMSDPNYKIIGGLVDGSSSGYPQILDEIAATRVAFDRFCVPTFQPKLSIVDEAFGQAVKDKALENLELKKLFWRVYYGPEYTERYGREFLLNTPAWKTEEFEGGVIVTITENYHEFFVMKHLDTLKYLRQKFKGMKVNKFSMGNF